MITEDCMITEAGLVAEAGLITEQHDHRRLHDHEGGRVGAEDGAEMVVVHRRYVSYAQAHYAGNLVDGAFSLACFGDVGTELCIRTDGDEGLFASYSDVQFKAPVRAGDVLEITGRLIRRGRRSREVSFQAVVVCRGRPDLGESAAVVLEEPIVATTATGTIVVPEKPADTPR
jgi:3-aminobutyryl-CoA ammonia-lyase